MKYTLEFNIDTFPWWAGAEDTVAKVRKANKMDELQSVIEEAFANEIPTKTRINDFVWFDKDYIYSHLGINAKGQET